MLQPIQTELIYHKQTSERVLLFSQHKGGGVKLTGQRKESNQKECLPVVHSAGSTRSIVSSAAHSSHHDMLPPIRTNIMEAGELGLKPWKPRALKSFSQVSFTVICLNNTCRQCVNEIIKPCPSGAYKKAVKTHCLQRKMAVHHLSCLFLICYPWWVYVEWTNIKRQQNLFAVAFFFHNEISPRNMWNRYY